MLPGLYMDVHIPAAITVGLRQRGVRVVTSQEDENREAADSQLLIRSSQLKLLLVTQDQDFLTLASEWQRSGRAFSGVAFAPQQGTSIGQLIGDLALVVECLNPDEVENRVVYLPLK